jgi:predicted glycosyltransferase involved in capsule biosynthesis
MPIISILIPFRDNGDRKDQLDWLQKRWEVLFPEAEVIIEPDDGKNPFSKTIAVNRCYKKATSNILAIVDADVWLDPKLFIKAAEDINSGSASWVRPCGTVYRLSEEFTKELVKSNPSSDFPEALESDCERITPTVGLVAVFSREQFEAVGGMDERFRGWGWEDTAWNILLDGIFGKAQVWDNIVYHLWHPRQRGDSDKPIWEGQTNRNNVVGIEYTKNKKNKANLLKIAEENKTRTGI